MSEYFDNVKSWKLGNISSLSVLQDIAEKNNIHITSPQFCEILDANDKLSHLRKEFIIPKLHSYPGVTIKCSNEEECTHFCGNSLGLQPKKACEIASQVLNDWATNGLECHFTGTLPAATCDEYMLDAMAELVGAHSDEVVLMNALTVNLHLLLVSFYQPTQKRHKILIESRAFPSDHYAVESQIKQRGYDPKESMIMVDKETDSELWSMDEIADVIRREGESIAVVLLPGVHYFTGQVFDMKRITKVAHEHGCMVGFDLAHAVGNIPLRLHDWNVDFAAWCTYKYLNSGPGCLGGAYMLRKHACNDFPKFLGWWGHKLQTRFQMNNELDISPGIQGYRVSNPPPLLVACIKASMDVFQKTSMNELHEKSFLLTGYLEALIHHYFDPGQAKHSIKIITPSTHRGCQLSLKFSCSVKEVHKTLSERGVVCDIREPDVMRVAPVPLYNTFKDVYKFVSILREILA